MIILYIDNMQSFLIMYYINVWHDGLCTYSLKSILRIIKTAIIITQAADPTDVVLSNRQRNHDSKSAQKFHHRTQSPTFVFKAF